jgi:hypothetical protein
MSENFAGDFETYSTPDAEIQSGYPSKVWRFKIHPGSKGRYRLAQMDDYTYQTRDCFRWRPPLKFSLRARVSAATLPGTWGFGLWNDPFSFSMGLGGGVRRFPVLPNAAWFFFGSPHNYLSFRSDLPANGFIAQTFRAARLPVFLMILGGIGLPLLLWDWTARRMRPLFQHLITEDNRSITLDPTEWNDYMLIWNQEKVTFKAGDQTFVTLITPNPPLGLVLWIDNQFAAFPPSGKLSYGTLTNPQPAWLEISDFQIQDF